MWQETSGPTRLNMANYAREVGSGSEKSFLKGDMGPRHTPDIGRQRSPFAMPSPSHDTPELLKAAVNVIEAVRRTLDDPRALTSCYVLQTGLYTHPCQASPTSHNQPPVNTCLPLPPYRCRCSERMARVNPSASLCAGATYVVVDLEEPRSLRPTIRWLPSGAMRHPA